MKRYLKFKMIVATLFCIWSLKATDEPELKDICVIGYLNSDLFKELFDEYPELYSDRKDIPWPDDKLLMYCYNDMRVYNMEAIFFDIENWKSEYPDGWKGKYKVDIEHIDKILAEKQQYVGDITFLRMGTPATLYINPPKNIKAEIKDQIENEVERRRENLRSNIFYEDIDFTYCHSFDDITKKELKIKKKYEIYKKNFEKEFNDFMQQIELKVKEGKAKIIAEEKTKKDKEEKEKKEEETKKKKEEIKQNMYKFFTGFGAAGIIGTGLYFLSKKNKQSNNNRLIRKVF